MTKEQLEFCGKFKEEHGDTVAALTLGRVVGTPEEIQSAGLQPLPGKTDIWGLLIIGEKGLHFYAHASDNPLMSLFRSASASSHQEPQYLSIPYDSVCGITIPETQKRQFWRLFGGTSDLRVTMTYTKADSNVGSMAIVLPDSNAEFLDLLRKRTAERAASAFESSAPPASDA